MLHSNINSARALLIALMLSPLPAGDSLAQCEIQELQGPGLKSTNFFGTKLAYRNGIAVVNAEAKEGQSTIHVHRVVTDNLVLQTVLNSPGPIVNDFGHGLSMNGNTIAVGDGAYPTEGAVFVYRIINGLPVIEQILVPSDTPFGALGQAVSVDDDVIAASAVDKFNPDGVYVFRFDGDLWYEEVKITPPPGDEIGLFGWSVAIANDVLLIGDHTDDGPYNLTGAAFVYRHQNGIWQFEKKLKPSDGGPASAQQWFGVALDLDAAGDTAVIGAKEDDGGLGSAYVFQYDGTDWVESAKLLPSQDQPDAWFGQDVAISDDGQAILIGAQLDYGGAPEGGAAYLFRLVENQWTLIHKFIKPNSLCLGAAVAFDGDIAVIGDPCGINGEVYIYAGINPVDCNNNGIPDGCDIASGASLDSDHDGIPNECDPSPDINADGHVNVDDLLSVINAWGPCPAPPPPPTPPASCPADVNLDGQVNVDDLLSIINGWGQLAEPTKCPASSEDCCVMHEAGDAGCADESCCNAVCALDPFCCQMTWDAICVNHAQALCGCSGPKACGQGGDCCEFNGNPSAGCNDPACCELVCEYIDPFCCDVQWDAACAQWAFSFCTCPPSACNPDAGPCCKEDQSSNPGCNDPECCQLVCAFDPFCCDVVWDPICVAWALDFCKICGGEPDGQ